MRGTTWETVSAVLERDNALIPTYSARYSLSGVILYHPTHWTSLHRVENQWYHYDDLAHNGALQRSELTWPDQDEARLLVYRKHLQ